MPQEANRCSANWLSQTSSFCSMSPEPHQLFFCHTEANVARLRTTFFSPQFFILPVATGREQTMTRNHKRYQYKQFITHVKESPFDRYQRNLRSFLAISNAQRYVQQPQFVSALLFHQVKSQGAESSGLKLAFHNMVHSWVLIFWEPIHRYACACLKMVNINKVSCAQFSPMHYAFLDLRKPKSTVVSRWPADIQTTSLQQPANWNSVLVHCWLHLYLPLSTGPCCSLPRWYGIPSLVLLKSHTELSRDYF